MYTCYFVSEESAPAHQGVPCSTPSPQPHPQEEMELHLPPHVFVSCGGPCAIGNLRDTCRSAKTTVQHASDLLLQLVPEQDGDCKEVLQQIGQQLQAMLP